MRTEGSLTKAQKPATPAASNYKDRGRKVKQTPIQFPPALIDKIDAAVKKHGYESRSALIRDAAEDLIRRLDKRKGSDDK